MNPTVCILTSGVGSRLEEYTKETNKALLTVDNKSALSLIIKNFPKNANFIISLGHKANLIKDFIKIHHPKIKVTFVNIKNYNRKGSGPGTSLIKCKKYLQKEFFFVSCDTLWKKKIFNFKNYNWMGVANQNKNKTEAYCNLITKKKFISKIIDKKKIKKTKNLKIFVGLAFIKDPKLFWDGFKIKNELNKEIQVTNGFRNLIKNKKVKGINIDWNDIGTKLNYEILINKSKKFNFSKVSQKIYISDTKVTKFFSDQKVVTKLYNRAKVNPKIFPSKLKKKNNFLTYQYKTGKTLYNYYQPKYLLKLIKFLDNKLWNKKILIKKNFIKDCKNFYFTKTQQRLKLIFEKYPKLEDKSYIINNFEVENISKIMKKIPWQTIFVGKSAFIHGDLQFDNIIYSFKNQFTLIDWRHEFGKNNLFGDLYYDYAKLLSGLEINYDLIKKNEFSINIKNQNIFLKSKKRQKSNILIKLLLKNANEKNLNENKIRIITGLIFLNMSPLHHYPFDKFLFYFGKYYLQKYLNKSIQK